VNPLNTSPVETKITRTATLNNTPLASVACSVPGLNYGAPGLAIRVSFGRISGQLEKLPSQRSISSPSKANSLNSLCRGVPKHPIPTTPLKNL
jgi:hypothetical protein